MKYTFDQLSKQLEVHEGFRQYPYKDTTGHLTIGIGRNIEERGISRNEANVLLRNDIAIVERELVETLPIVEAMSAPRQLALVDMAFNLGMPTFLQFENMIANLKAQNWEGAADEMLASRWAEQVGSRAETLAKMMREGHDGK